MDGSLSKGTGNKGRFSLELSFSDLDILEVFQLLIPEKSSITSRSRCTNFLSDYKSATLRVNTKEFRDRMCGWGLPYGRKSLVVNIPAEDYSPSDYWRGVIDADGSVGISARGVPFITLTTKSDGLKDEFTSYVGEVTGFFPNISRNKRDDIYNFTVANRNARMLCKEVYYPECLALPRKYEKAMEVINSVTGAGLARSVARLEPKFVIKGDD